MKKQILELIDKIRNILNSPWKFNRTVNKQFYFSAFDVIEDTVEAINYYKNNTNETLGYKYLAIHGLLESMYIQQKSLNVISNVLGYGEIDFKSNFPQIYEISEIRNDISGHPSRRGSLTNGYSTFLNRHSLCKEKFEYTRGLATEIIPVDVFAIIEEQEKFVVEFLDKNILQRLKEEEKEHYSQYKNIKCEILFKELPYAKSKIYKKGYFYTKDDDFGFDIIENILEKFKQCLNDRYSSWEKVEHISYKIKEIEEIIQYIKTHDNIIDETDIDGVFLKKNLLENLFTKMEDIEESAKYIDKEYTDYFLPKNEFEEGEMPPILIRGIDMELL